MIKNLLKNLLTMYTTGISNSEIFTSALNKIVYIINDKISIIIIVINDIYLVSDIFLICFLNDINTGIIRIIL